MKVGVYARVSTSDKDQDPETQLMPLRDFIESQGWEVYKTYVDMAPANDLVAAFAAVGVEFDSLAQTIAAAWMTQAAIGMAVALPSAPGFIGPYHYACKLALEGFGIPPETAIALGTLIHAVFWVSLTGLGLLVLRARRTPLAEIDEAAASSNGPSSE